MRIVNLSEDRTPAGAMETGLATAGDPICRVIQIFREKPWSSSMAVDGDGVKPPEVDRRTGEGGGG